jgi:hypothetical protein
LITVRIVVIRPSSTSSDQVLSTLLSRSWKIAPGWPFTSCGSQRTFDLDEPGEGRSEHPDHILDTEDPSAPLRGVAAAVPDHLHVRGEQVPQALDVAVPDRIEEARRLAFLIGSSRP